jgi:hypothetical protein
MFKIITLQINSINELLISNYYLFNLLIYPIKYVSTIPEKKLLNIINISTKYKNQKNQRKIQKEINDISKSVYRSNINII